MRRYFYAFRNTLSSQKGSAFIIFGISAVVLIAFVSLVTDIGMMALHKAKLTNAVDAAALAGAQELIYKVYPPEARAEEYLYKNNYLNDSIRIKIEDDNSALRVSASYVVKFWLARVLGYNSKSVSATAKGKVLPVIAINSGARPFAIENQELQFGVQYTLKEGGGDGTTGNYGAIELGGSGAKVYYNNIVNGYNGRLMVGDYIDTEPGNMSGPTESGIEQLINQCNHNPRCTFDHFVPSCPRVITVIIVDSLDVNGRSTVQIKGFASFFLEGVSGNGDEVIGRFIKTVTSGEVGETQEDYGLYGVKLMP